VQDDLVGHVPSSRTDVNAPVAGHIDSAVETALRVGPECSPDAIVDSLMR
jgi:hypothetical protein